VPRGACSGDHDDASGACTRVVGSKGHGLSTRSLKCGITTLAQASARPMAALHYAGSARAAVDSSRGRKTGSVASATSTKWNWPPCLWRTRNLPAMRASLGSGGAPASTRVGLWRIGTQRRDALERRVRQDDHVRNRSAGLQYLHGRRRPVATCLRELLPPATALPAPPSSNARSASTVSMASRSSACSPQRQGVHVGTVAARLRSPPRPPPFHAPVPVTDQRQGGTDLSRRCFASGHTDSHIAPAITAPEPPGRHPLVQPTTTPLRPRRPTAQPRRGPVWSVQGMPLRVVDDGRCVGGWGQERLRAVGGGDEASGRRDAHVAP
jgi:hypothetical protein